jgi:hypothetical protein
MDIFKMIIRAILILSLLSLTSNAFEQNGVKDGNMKISASLYTTQAKDDFNTMNLNSQTGYFYGNNIEILIGLEINVKQKEFYYTLLPGINYYFLKKPIVTPYIGTQMYYNNTSNEYIQEEKGYRFYLGTHLFISEDIAVTPELGAIYEDFNREKGTYFNTFLTYFF